MKVYRQWNSGVDWSMKQLHARVASVHHGCCACSLHAPPPWSRYTSSPESPLVVSARWQASECDLLENTFLHWHWPTSRLHSSTRPKPQTKCILISSVQLPQLDNGFCRRTCLNNSPIILFNHWKYNTIQNSFSFSNIWALLYNRNVGETPLTCLGRSPVTHVAKDLRAIHSNMQSRSPYSCSLPFKGDSIMQITLPVYLFKVKYVSSPKKCIPHGMLTLNVQIRSELNNNT